MATTIRTASTDADYESWRAVRIAVMPYERCPTVTEIRALDRPGRLLVLAEVDGAVVGSGLADHSGDGQRASLTVLVRPDFRRRGVATEVLRVIAEHVVAQGFDTAGTFVDDEGSRRFTERFGFVERNREVEQVRRIGAEPWPAPPTGYEIVSVAQHREWRGRSVASTLKRTSMAWAAEHGITEIYTWTQRGNEAMRRLNERLGFTYGIVSITMRAPLPLAEEPTGPR